MDILKNAIMGIIIGGVIQFMLWLFYAVLVSVVCFDLSEFKGDIHWTLVRFFFIFFWVIGCGVANDIYKD